MSHVIRLRERIQAAANDPAPILGPEALGVAFALRDSLAPGGIDLEALYTLGEFHWRRSAALGADKGRADRQAAVRYFGPCFIDGRRAVPAELLAELADAAIPEAAKRLHYARESTDVSFISATIELWRRIAGATPEDHEDYLPRLVDLSNSLSERYRRAGALADINEAIEIDRQIVEIDRRIIDVVLVDPAYLINLSVDLCDRYERTGSRADIGEAFAVAVRAVAATPLAHPRRQDRLRNLTRAANLNHHQAARSDELSALLGATQQRVIRYLSEGNSSIIFDEAATAEAFALCAAAEDLTSDLDLLGAVAWLFWFRGSSLGDVEGEKDLTLAISFFRIFCRKEPTAVPAEVRMAVEGPDRPSQEERDDRLEVAANLMSWHESTGQVDALASAIQVLRETVPKLPRASLRLSAMGVLSAALKLWYEILGDESALEEAITLLRDAVNEIAEDDPARSSYQRHLDDLLSIQPSSIQLPVTSDEPSGHQESAPDPGVQEPISDETLELLKPWHTQFKRYQATNDAANLEQAIISLRAAQEMSRGGSDERTVTALLANNLTTWSERVGDTAALTEAISLLRGLVARSHNDEHVVALTWALKLRVEQADDREALEEALAILRRAADGPSRDKYLNELGCLLGMYYEEYGEIGAEEEALSVLREAARLPGDERSEVLNNLGHVLVGQARRTGDLDTINEGINVLRRAVRAAAGEGPSPAAVIFNLASALEYKFYRTQDVTALNEAIALMRDCLRTVPPDDGDRPMWLGNLGMALQLRHEATGDLETLAEAVTVTREALQAGESKFGFSATLLGKLGRALKAWFQSTGDVAALEESIVALRRAVDALPAHHPEMAKRLSNLGIALSHSYERSSDRETLAAAVDVLQRAVAETSTEHADTAMHLNNLALILGELEAGDPRRQPEEIIRLFSEAVRLTPVGDPARPIYMNNLASALSTYQGRSDDAISLLRQATADQAERHPLRGMLWNNLGELLLAQGSYEEAAAAFKKSALTAPSPPLVRTKSGRKWANAAAAHGALDEALVAMSSTIALLPQLAPRHLRQADSQLGLAKLAGLASDAAAIALRAGTNEQAIQLLESGRGVLLTRALETRGDEHTLRERAPGLASRYVRLRGKLNEPLDLRSATAAPPDTWRLTEGRRAASQEWTRLMEEIRSTPGLGGFQRPPQSNELKAQAETGPIVVINVSQFSTDAIILTSEQIYTVPLPSVNLENTAEKGHHLLEALEDLRSERLSPRERIACQGRIFEILEWLWDDVTEPVLEKLGLVKTLDPNAQWPRLWWCPTGPLCFLPLHAAGHHRNATSSRTVMDRVVSSYTPTIGALAHARRSLERPRRSPDQQQTPATSALIIGSSGSRTLIEANREIKKLVSILPHTEVLNAEDVSLVHIVDALPEHQIAHFVCHGITNPSDPAENALILPSGQERLTASQISQLDLRGAELAFLSACDTARTTSDLIDEAIHITGAFQLAGYPHVIGTLWSIDDTAAADIAVDTYERRSRGIATALHQAVRRARYRYPGAPSLWAAHVHVGP